ncbi:I78 family peptidase inhibitor [Tabrizicola sp.]|uniref:I78 family peptidase inhibitor n=1 Tax=Tabrizicola sp. TaxID=2005166 RepID=UPI002734D8DD|nr:I78 family peptidase inhibitor [Tabrizicola sp.]MDP3198142.1 I78 family peptidase inhibitor [Tabrizicola sp.]
MDKLALAGLLALGLQACVDTTGPTACGAAGMQDLVGRDQAVLAAMTFPAGTRLIGPDTAVTEDYRPDRLNIDIDAGGRITRLWCG